MQPFTFFISYRRQDTAPIALLLKNEIEKRLQFVRVSVDVEEMQPGDPFPDRLRGLIDAAHATIVLIGKRWMPKVGEQPAEGPSTDWVVEELVYSNEAPLALPEGERFGQNRRLLVPLFADCDRDFRQFALPTRLDFLTVLHSEHIDYAGWPTMIGPLLDRLAVKLSLKKRPDADEYPKADLAKARTQPLPDAELAQILRYDDFEGWYVDNYGNAEVRYLVKTFKFPHFDQAADFMALVSNHCRVLDHHPEWRNVFNHVTVSLTTWDAQRRVTIYDMNLALFMNMAAKAVIKAARSA
ncbi:4a-hydroxytetrahydrobiopterin dehydratase [Cognatazoarcus halotolerans]|uniref:4a-hydroxytetrahydrobiopterin dehydratase n=1 Tax=Cognatazoarcus halotolerans TaxID=2686016 RepID=UPI00135823EB|nr:4a-hydroxytetrahydrobiopterin dehydratase [Cognatazoarcus halotolerans]MCB1902489.1 4a-hydroxytetrahydrobiopterin dehydratase [Rhodocyclaceae bacterium]MCP5310270.1 4a-hydroxytetrahydrobiopterin dehydratase [Zoogloeaceae bacterium]